MTLTFGNILTRLLEITGERNYAFANYVKYDVSYISKWISGSKLPSEKYINEIIEHSCNFFIDNRNFTILENIKFELELNVLDKGDIYTNYKNSLKNLLFNAFEQQKATSSKNNSLLIPNCTILPKNVDPNAFISEAIRQYGNRSREEAMHIIISHTIDSYETKYSVADISTSKKNIFNQKKVDIDQVINLNDYNYNINEYCKLILMYLNKDSGVDLKLYNTDKNENLSIVLVKNCLALITIKDNNFGISMNCVSKDLSVVNKLYNDYSQSLRNQPPILDVQTQADFSNQKYFIDFIMNDDTKIILHQMEALCFPDVALAEMLTSLDIQLEKSFFYELNKSIQHSKVKAIIYKSAFLNYMIDGILHIYNKKIIIEKDLRIRHLKTIIEILHTNPEFEIKLIENDNPIISITDLDSSVFINAKSCFTIANYEDEQIYNNFLNYKVIENFNIFFLNIWDDSSIYVTEIDEVIQFIEKGINYLQNS